MRGTGISYLFVHVGPLDDNDTLDPAKVPGATWFAAELHTLIPGVRLQAWLGDEIEPSGGTGIESPHA